MAQSANLNREERKAREVLRVFLAIFACFAVKNNPDCLLRQPASLPEKQTDTSTSSTQRLDANSLRYTFCMTHQRIGLFGGTFDPPHLAHLLLASESAYQFDLSRVLWVLTPNPPHKDNDPITVLEHRLAMLNLAIADNPLFELSRIELDRPGPHYSVDTVRLLAAQEPDAEITLLIGGDSLHDLPTWRSPLDLIAAVQQIGVMRRPGDSVDLSSLEEKISGVSQKVRFVDTLLQDISSTEIRRRIANREPYRYYLLPAVYEYIAEHDLYRS